MRSEFQLKWIDGAAEISIFELQDNYFDALLGYLNQINELRSMILCDYFRDIN